MYLEQEKRSLMYTLFLKWTCKGFGFFGLQAKFPQVISSGVPSTDNAEFLYQNYFWLRTGLSFMKNT